MGGKFIPSIIHWFETHRKLSIVIIIGSLALVIYPRFDRQNIGIDSVAGLKAGELNPDTRQYTNFVKYFRQEVPIDSISPPFSFRPLVPYLASLTPANAFTGIDIINLISLYLSLPCIFFIMRKYSFSFGYATVGCLLYIFSFPVFYYGVVGYIDTPMIFMVAVIVLAAVYNQYALLPLLLMIGVFVKEGTIVVFPFLVLHVWQRSRTNRERMTRGIFVALSLVTFLIGYKYCRATFAGSSNYLWTPNFSSIQENLSRPKAYFSFLLTFGLVGVLSVFEFLRAQKASEKSLLHFLKEYPFTPLVAGIITSFMLWVYTLVAAYVDGRYFWLAYPFMIPMAVQWIKEKYSHSLRAASSIG